MVRLEIPEPTTLGVHFVHQLELQEPVQLQPGSWVRTLRVTHSTGVFDLKLFSDSPTNLEIPNQLQLPLGDPQ